jgi:hemoglobin-like flavoprotein
LSEEELAAFHDSFERCMKDPRFFDLFYERFLASSPEVAGKFRNTDFKRQKHVLRMSLFQVVDVSVRRATNVAALRPLAVSHSRRKADIRPQLYDLWLDSLVATVEECDPLCTSSTERLWRQAFQPAIAYIVSHY